MKEVFVIWNIKDSRLAVSQVSYAPLMIFLTEEQAEAYLRAWEKENDENRVMRVQKWYLTSAIESVRNEEKK